MPAKILKQKLNNARRIAVLGVGSELRGDDIAGLLAAQQIEKTITKQTTSPHSTRPDKSALAQGGPEVRVFIGETAPENLTGEIKKFQPTHLIIIDAAELNKEPGHIEIMEPGTIGGTSFCTHSLPLKIVIGYLLESFKFQAIIIGIQPKTLVFGAQPTKEVVAAAKHIAKAITELLTNK
jgi:hydrogenase 3 maturation protease